MPSLFAATKRTSSLTTGLSPRSPPGSSAALSRNVGQLPGSAPARPEQNNGGQPNIISLGALPKAASVSAPVHAPATPRISSGSSIPGIQIGYSPGPSFVG